MMMRCLNYKFILVVLLVRGVQDEVLGKEWQLMPRPSVDLSDTTKAAVFIERATQISAAMRTGISQLARKHQAIQGEVLSRPGLSLQSQAVRCIFGMGSSSDVEGCLEIADVSCETCQAICCDFHQVHDLHKDFANESSIFRQQAAVAQQNLCSAPAVAAPKETPQSKSGDETKKARKNTWADLLQRYESIKGEAYEKPAGQKVGDFQLMVEGLEGRLSAKQEPEQSKSLLQSTPASTEITAEDLDSASFEEFRQYRRFLAMRNRESAMQQPPAADGKPSSRNNMNNWRPRGKGGCELASDCDDDDDD